MHIDAHLLLAHAMSTHSLSPLFGYAHTHTCTHTCTHTHTHTHTHTQTQTKVISAESCYAQDLILGCLQSILSLMNLLVELISNSDVIFPSDLEVIAVALWNSTEYVQHV